jgi:hypothetical protein
MAWAILSKDKKAISPVLSKRFIEGSLTPDFAASVFRDKFCDSRSSFARLATSSMQSYGLIKAIILSSK